MATPENPRAWLANFITLRGGTHEEITKARECLAALRDPPSENATKAWTEPGPGAVRRRG